MLVHMLHVTTNASKNFLVSVDWIVWLRSWLGCICLVLTRSYTMLESHLINSVLSPVIVLFGTWLSLCHMLVFNAFLTVHTTFFFFYVYFFYFCVFVFLCVVCCVCQWSLVDWFSNKRKWKKTCSRKSMWPSLVLYICSLIINRISRTFGVGKNLVK